MNKFLILVGTIALLALVSFGQGPAKTVITDTLSGPDGLPANGQVVVINPQTFTSPDGYIIPAQSRTVAQITNGALTISLVPNAIGTYYVANYSLSSGGFSEYWMVPVSSSPVTLQSLRAQPPQLNVPNFMFAFYQLNPPANCLNMFPEWTSTGWTCSSAVGAFANQQLSNLSGTVAINQSLNVVPLSRITMTGTSLSSSDFSISGWGSSATTTVIGTDTGFTLTIVASGIGQTLNPTITLTFHDGPFANAPVYVCVNGHGTSNRADVDYAPTTSILPITWLSTPNASQTYVISCIGLGR